MLWLIACCAVLFLLGFTAAVYTLGQPNEPMQQTEAALKRLREREKTYTEEEDEAYRKKLRSRINPDIDISQLKGRDLDNIGRLISRPDPANGVYRDGETEETMDPLDYALRQEIRRRGYPI